MAIKKFQTKQACEDWLSKQENTQSRWLAVLENGDFIGVAVQQQKK